MAQWIPYVLACSLLLCALTAAAPTPRCTSSGQQINIDGQTHTCGVCLGGTTGVWFIGDLEAADATDACERLHDKTVKVVAPTAELTLEEEKGKTLEG